MQHKWAEVIKAWLDGNRVQCRKINYDLSKWMDFDGKYLTYFDNTDFEWRIKPIKRYRVAALLDGEYAYTLSIHNESGEQLIQNSKHFVRWLTDWVEYE